MPARAGGWIAATSLSLCLCQPALAQKKDSGEGEQKQIRPAGGPLRVDNVPPQLLKILKDWEHSSAKLKKLQGEHVRWEYDYVFGVVKRNLGKFYYESPDKGRIDLKPDKDAVKPVSGKPPVDQRKHWENGKLVAFKIQEGQSERWYCDGQLITQVDEVAKTALQILIPKENQGERIIDGPLPFLFGMPADKAVLRFDLKLISNKDGKATIHAIPKLRADAANYRLAQIILDLDTYLPDAVRLIDPAGTKETVFLFKKMQANSLNIGAIFGADPFVPNLKSYQVHRQGMGDRADQDLNGKRVVPAAGVKASEKPSLDDRPLPTEARPAVPPKKKSSTANVAVPSVVDLHYKQAQQTLLELGFTVKLKEGKTARRPDQVFRVEVQDPEPKTQLAPGEPVILWLYTKLESNAKE